MLVLRAPAKINLTLEVLDRRADGMHALRSLMVPLDLADELTIEPQAYVTIACDPPLPDGAPNLARRAFEAALPGRGARIFIRKHIPVGSGMGGGSSDAAAVLLAAADRALGDVGSRDWLAIARALGSDVPFFLARTGALVEGAGERVTAAGALPAWSVLAIKPPASISTADAYARIDAAPRVSRPRNASVTLRALAALQRGDFDTVAACLSNDFESAALEHPDVARAFDALRAAGATHVLLAGSGSAVFAVTATQAQRDAIAQRLSVPSDYTVFATEFARGSAWRA